MWLITIKMPDGIVLKYRVTTFKDREGRILFTDHKGQAKNFPRDACFIEGVGQ